MSDRAAFDAELLTHLPHLSGFAKSLLRGRGDASDLVQETVARALKSHHQFTIGTNMRAWLCLIMRNLHFTENRRAWRMVQAGEGQAEAMEAADDQFQRLALEDALAALQRMSPAMRETVLMLALGADYETVARHQGVALGTVKSRAHRGRQIIISEAA